MMRRFCTVSIAVVFISLFIHPPNVSPAESNSREIIAVALRNWPPQFLTDEKTGAPAGFAVDIMNRVAELSGLKVRYVVYDHWPDALEALRNNQAALAPNMGITDERLRLYDFTLPYETFRISIFVRSATVDIDEVSDLAGRRVGVVKANQGLVLMREHGGSDLQIFTSLEETFMALLSGRIDALVYPEQVLSGIAMRSGLEGKIKIVGKPLQEIKRGIAVRKGEPELFLKLDNAIRQLIKTPEYKMIYEKWYGKPEPFWNVARVIVVMGLVLGLTIAGLLAWRYGSILKLNISLSETVAELKKAEAALRRSEAKYFDLYQNAPDMYVSVDAATGTILECNRTFVQASGYASKEILGRPIFEMYHPDSLEGAKAAFQSFVSTGEARDVELQLQRKDGSTLDVSLNVSAVRDEDGKILYSRSSWRDITARKQTEEALCESEERLRITLEETQIGIWDWDIKNDIWHASPTYYTMLGYEPEKGHSDRKVWLNRVYPDDRIVPTEKIRNVLNGANSKYQYEVRMRHADGSYRWISVLGHTIEQDINGKPSRMIGVRIDITERKQAEEELKIINEELLAINRIITTTTTTTGVKGILENVLDEALAVTGLEGGTICLVTPDDTLDLAAHRATSEATIQDLTTNIVKIGDCLCGQCARDHKPLILADRAAVLKFATREATRGEDIRFHAAFPLLSGAECLGVLCVFTRTDKKPSQRSLKLLETVSAQIALAVENAQLYEETLRQAVILESKVRERTKALEENRQALMNIVENLNEKSEALNAANVKLLELDRLKSMFIASMSHELRTPLNSIIGFTGIILQGMAGEINDEQQDQLKRVYRSGKHLLALINDVIDISKIEAGKIDVRVEKFDLNDVIQEAVSTLKPEIEEKGLDLHVTISPGLTLRTDRKRLLQCILNYLNNAVKYTEKGKISIEGRETRDEGRGTRDEVSSVVLESAANGRPTSVVTGSGAAGLPSSIVISVTDTGIGIEEKDMSEIFKPFIRVDSPLRTVTLGTGLGLYLTNKLTTEALQGSVSVKSHFGEGSTFFIKIPKDLARDERTRDEGTKDEGTKGRKDEGEHNG